MKNSSISQCSCEICTCESCNCGSHSRNETCTCLPAEARACTAQAGGTNCNCEGSCLC